MTKEEVEQAFNGVSPYYAYKQGVQDGAAYNEESFRREAAKDILVGICANWGKGFAGNIRDMPDRAIELADVLIAKLKEK